MTVLDQVASDVMAGVLLYEREPSPCVICGDRRHLRYGCCLRCAARTDWDDARVTRDVRVGGRPS